MKVQEMLMTKPSSVVSVGPHQLIREAARLMAEHNIGLLPVLDNKGQLVGVISERDIVREAVNIPTPLFDEQVQRIMTSQVIVATPHDELSSLVNAMVEKNIRHLPVMDGDELIGILSIKDVLKALQAKYEGEIHQLQYYLG
jgi:CBS domain-containing protein